MNGHKFQKLDAPKVHRITPRSSSVLTKSADFKPKYVVTFVVCFYISCHLGTYMIMYYCSFRSTRIYNEPLDMVSMKKLARKNFSEETIRKVTWVRRMYSQWRIERNERSFDEQILCDLDDHETITEDNLVFGMCRFVREITKVNGEQFPGKTLYEMVMCVQFHLESIGFMWRLLNQDKFVDLKFTLDNVMKERCSMNVGGPVRKAEVLSAMNVDILWENCILGIDSPEKLLATTFFMIGMSCALRAGKEHQKLRCIPFQSQFAWDVDNSGRHYLKYTEDITQKTNRGGLKHRKVVPKSVNVCPIPGSNRCPVMVIMKYMSLLPVDRKCKAFYLQPKKCFTPNCWYQDRPVGLNKLQSMVRVVCEQGGIPGFYTNHSLRATAATRLYHNDIDEQIIQEVTGHRSVAVREYKRTSDDQKFHASACIMGTNVPNKSVKRKYLSQ